MIHKVKVQNLALMRGDRLLFLAASALGNVGLSHDRVVPSTAGLYVLSATMFGESSAPRKR